LAALIALGAGCGSDKKAEEGSSPISLEATEQIASEEDDLLARRDALFNMRRDLQDKRETLAKKREELKAGGGDTAEVDRQARELLAREGKLVEEEREWNRQFAELQKQRQAMMASFSTGGPAGGEKSKEAAVAARERAVAMREERIGKREAALAKREEDLATKWKDSCVLGAPQTIVKTVDIKGSKYTKKDVEPLLGKARRAMSKKGVLSSDLPAQAQGLEREATKAMAEGDYGRARFAADQLVRTVRGIRIDKAFIAAKIGRLNGAIKGKSLSGAKQKSVDSLFREATALYGDAKFSRANRRLNSIYSEIR
jgi:hypothetical protein